MVRLLRAPDRPRDLADARGHDRRRGDARPVRAGARTGSRSASSITIDPEAGMIEADLTDNIDCLPAGVNESRTCAMNNCMTGHLQLDRPGHPAQRRHLPARDGEAARELRRRHPALPALVLGGDDERRRAPRRDDAADDRRRLGRATGWRRARAASAPGFAVVSGTDWRKDDEPVREPEVPRLAGRPGGPEYDGWVTYGNAVTQRPDVPRQRRDRRAEVPDPHPRDPGRAPTPRAPAGARRARHPRRRSARSTTR